MLPLTSDLSLLAAAGVADVTGGCLLRGDGVARGVSTDTRTLRPGDLFVALAGADHDGHAFLADAVGRGASGVVVSRTPSPDLAAGFVVLVEDTTEALLDLAAAHRARLGARVLGITGSCGKTSTKEIATHLLAPHFRTVASERSFNNAVGVPLTLFRADAGSELVIVEIGTNAPGEIARLSAAAAPDIAVITLIGRSHLEGLGSVAGVFAEKAALIDALPPDGIAVLNADDPHYRGLRERAGKRQIWSFGIRFDADLRATGLRPALDHIGLHIVARDSGHRIPVELPRLGLHDVRNLLAALCVGRALGIELAQLLGSLPSLPPTPRRLQPKVTSDGVRILDDTYNANPESLLAALAVLDAASGVRRKVLVLGDMLELGADAPAIHAAFGPQLVGRIDMLVTVGPLAARTGAAFAEATGDVARGFADVEALIPALRPLLRPGDLVLCKASRRVALDRAVDALLA